MFVRGFVPLSPLKKNFIVDIDEVEHAKKVVKMSKFWDDPPIVVKIQKIMSQISIIILVVAIKPSFVTLKPF